MGVLRVLSRAGDQAVEWDEAAVAGGDAEALAAVAEAERICVAALVRGGYAFSLAPGRPAARVFQFDATRPLTIVVSPIAGG
jgi:hypothetical protein